MDRNRSLMLALAGTMIALSLAGCSRRNRDDDGPPPPPPPPPAEHVLKPRPAPVEGNVAEGVNRDSPNDGAFSPDYAPPPANGSGNQSALPQH